MPPSIFRTPDFSNQFPFPLEVRKIGIPLYFETKTCPFWLTVYITNDKIYALMYALFIVLKWLYIGKQSTVFSTGTSQMEPGIHSVCDKVLFCDAFQLSCEIEIRRFVHPVYTKH